MKKFIIFLLMISGLRAQAQTDSNTNVGFGSGIDFGGFGVRVTHLPHKRIGLFAGLGYNQNSQGYNVGAQFRFPSDKKICFYLTGMYGYNAVLIAKGTINKKETYYGPSAGVGFELKTKREKNFWSFELLFPMRDSKLKTDIDNLRALGASVTDPEPVAFSFGYHIRIY